jgi:Mg-chelatase subunit ChlD
MKQRFGLVGLVGVGLGLAALTACGSAPRSEAAAPESIGGRDAPTGVAAAPGDYSAEADVAMAATGAPLAPSPAAPPGAGALGGAAKMDVTGRAPSASLALATGMTSVKAGEWDDNANHQDFTKYIRSQQALGITNIDVFARRFLVVEDAQGKGVPSCSVTVRDAAQGSVAITTAASGRAILFPHALGLGGTRFTASTKCLGQLVTTSFDMSEPDGETTLKLKETRSAIGQPTIDVVFVLDTTGSMSEEIQGVKDTMQAVVGKLDRRAKIRVGLVEYKDKGDDLVTKVYPMSTDLTAFASKISGIEASGGGDVPENVDAGISVAVNQMQWNDKADARLAFLIADAPPHLDYPDVPGYDKTAIQASKRGIKFYTVSASGMDDLGQAVFRQIAQVTGGTNMFVLRGGAGAQSTGAGDAKSSCGGTHQNFSSGNLDDLIVHKIALEIASLSADPHRIAGLGKDEDAKPCADRIQLVAE